MVVYKYNLIWDLKLFLHNKNNRRSLEKKGVVFIPFRFFQYIKLVFSFFANKLELPNIEVEGDYVCYIVSSGTWGAYELPNKVFICPLKLDQFSMTLEDLIMHEITHLKFENEFKDLGFDERERKINEMMKEISLKK